MTAPTISVVINTFNRSDLVGRAIGSVLAQDFENFELVVLDDGSTDDTATEVASFADRRLQYVRQENAGLSAARNAGYAATSAEWVTFLDDDDVPLPGWLRTLTAYSSDATVGVVCGGFRSRSVSGAIVGQGSPLDLGPLFGNETALFLAGTFAVRRKLFDAAGRYLPGIPVSHQTELGIRLVMAASEQDLSIRAFDRQILQIERRDPTDRPGATPIQHYYGAKWLLERFPDLFESDPQGRADTEGVLGVAAARIGRWPEARQHLLSAARSDPKKPKRWVRVALSTSPAVGRHVWGHEQKWSGDVASKPLSKVPRGPEPTPENLFLPWRYRVNDVRSSDARGTPFWEGGTKKNDVRYQAPVYRFARAFYQRHGTSPVIDIGCGSGDKLVRYFSGPANDIYGVDQGSAIEIARKSFPDRQWLQADLMVEQEWESLLALRPSLVICADVIEHVEDPRYLLGKLNELLGTNGTLILSTPDRARLDYSNNVGPPSNLRHVREWSARGLSLLLEAENFDILESRHFLPRSYSATAYEFKRTLWRGLHRRAVPDRRYNVAFLARSPRS